MEAYQTRVGIERKELDEKIALLTKFIESQVYVGLPNAEKERLRRQIRAMVTYSDVLAERIAAFKPA